MTPTSADRHETPRRWPWRVALASVLVMLLTVLIGTQRWSQREDRVLTDANAEAAAALTPSLVLRRGGAYTAKDAMRGDDRIVLATPGGDQRTVFTAPRIQTYVADDRWVVVAAVSQTDTATTLTAVDRAAVEADPAGVHAGDAHTVALALPTPGTVIGLAVHGDLVTATFTPLDLAQESHQTLVWRLEEATDVSDGTTGGPSPSPSSSTSAGAAQADATLVTMPDGTAALADLVLFTRDGRFLLLRQADSTLVRLPLPDAVAGDAGYDAAEREALPLGAADDVTGWSATGELMVTDASGGWLLVDVGSGARQRLDASLPAGVPADARLVSLWPTTTGAVAVYARVGDAGIRQEVWGLGVDGATRLAAVDGEDAITGVCPAPDGRLVAVTTRADGSADDGYVLDAGPLVFTTTVLPVDQPVAVGDLPGRLPEWCQTFQRVPVTAA